MRFRTVRGPLLLTLWAFAPPIPVPVGDGDTITVSVGAVAAEYEVVSRSCEDEVLSSRGAPARTGAVQVEYESPDAPIRISAFGGLTSVENESSRDDPRLEAEGGAFAGGLLAYEGNTFGLGLGAVRVPGRDAGLAPSFYGRVGDREGPFLQADWLAPTPMPGATGLFRAGVGVGGDRVSSFFGLSAGRALDLSGEANAGPFGELAISLAAGFDALLGGSLHLPEEHSDWGAGIGVRWRPGI